MRGEDAATDAAEKGEDQEPYGDDDICRAYGDDTQDRTSRGTGWETGRMSRMTGRSIGVWSLRLDAIYCLLLGAFVAVAAPHLATAIALPASVLTVTGVVVVVWSALVLWMVARMRLRSALRLVLCVNILATVLILASSFVATNALVVIAVLAVASEVALFALSQAVAIRRLRTSPPVGAAA